MPSDYVRKVEFKRGYISRRVFRFLLTFFICQRAKRQSNIFLAKQTGSPILLSPFQSSFQLVFHDNRFLALSINQATINLLFFYYREYTFKFAKYYNQLYGKCNQNLQFS